MSDHIDINRLLEAPWFHFREIPSTNRFLITKGLQGAIEGSTCTSQSQTSGYGRRNHRWVSPPGGVYFSILFRPEHPSKWWSQISLLVAVAAARAIEICINDIKIQLKWPNDLMCQAQKIGGILMQSRFTSSPFVIAGIGINLQIDHIHFPKRNLFPANSLHNFTNQNIDFDELTTTLREQIIRYYLEWENSPIAYRSEWLNRSFCLNKFVKIKIHDKIVEGFVRGIDRVGRLKIQLEQRHQFISEGEFLEVNSSDDICS